ncbi:hypothetical protein Cfor_05169 [Coptotermes formosanus]|uniref:DEP domain-containing protein n=1 Tax=Coptotermes formosanus TaxID=36987 RepID=A0A6L2PC68_COPFO|nr:hypothetical protein Cfor_05169 [Coptotermes formosanus]
MQSPSPQMAWVGWTLHTLLLADSSSSVLRDHRSSNSNCVYQRCASGRELIDWIMSLSPSIHTRHQAIGMWQVLLEEGVIFHGNLRSVAQSPNQRASVYKKKISQKTCNKIVYDADGSTSHSEASTLWTLFNIPCLK